MSILTRDLVPLASSDDPAAIEPAGVDRPVSGRSSGRLSERALSLFGGARRKLKKAEAQFDALRLRIVAAEPRRPNRNDAIVIALSSRTRGEGVSTVALALARSFARGGEGRVLLIDSDEVSNDLVRRAPQGTATIIEDPEDLTRFDEVEQVAEWQVDLLAMAAARNGESPIQQGPAWDDYLSAMRARYDVIVVDTGSLQAGALQLWAGIASQVLLVVDTTRTTVQALERLGKDLKSANQALTGVVLNKRDYPIPQFLY